MTVDLMHVLHQAVFGALAASGFGILFNFGWRELPGCAASGALALTTRTLGLEAGWNLEAASFAAAAVAGCAAQLLHTPFLRTRFGTAGNALAVAGCIPMVPGAFAAQSVFGLIALTAPQPHNAETTLVTTMESLLRVVFTIAALGTGLSITAHIRRRRDSFL